MKFKVLLRKRGGARARAAGRELFLEIRPFDGSCFLCKERLGTSQEQAGQVRRWLRSGEARARMAGRAGSAYGEPPMSRCGPAFPRSFRPSNRRKRRIAHVMAFAKLAPPFFVRDSVVFSV